MGKKIDLTGQSFGRLVVIKEAGRNKFGHVMWLCKCDCGNEVSVNGNSLRRGFTISCGCYQRELASDYNTTHGLKKSNPRLYNSVRTHFLFIRKGRSGYRNWTLDVRYPNNAEGAVKFCRDLLDLQSDTCARYETDETLDLDKDNNTDNIFRPESIVFRQYSENRSKHCNNLKLDDGLSLVNFCRQVGIETTGENGKPSKQYYRICAMYRYNHKVHPELIAKANEYLTLLKRLRASIDLLKDVREFMERCKGLQRISLPET